MSIARYSIDKVAGLMFKAKAGQHGAWVKHRDHVDIMTAMEKKVADLQEEVRLDDARIESFLKLMRLIPACPSHGDQCIPHACEWVTARIDS